MTTVGSWCRPRLARGVRLRWDRITGKTLLLRPEQGFELHGSAAEILKLCTADRTVAQIVDHLADSHDEAARDQIAEDVPRLLADLAGRGLVVLEGDS